MEEFMSTFALIATPLLMGLFVWINFLPESVPISNILPVFDIDSLWLALSSSHEVRNSAGCDNILQQASCQLARAPEVTAIDDEIADVQSTSAARIITPLAGAVALNIMGNEERKSQKWNFTNSATTLVQVKSR
ncbi:hypothetical protein SLE2022_349650 [Rubroshorea leprosula]